MTENFLSVKPRQKTGKGAARALRRDGYIPAIIYGKDGQNQNVQIKYKDLINEINKGRFSSKVVTIDNGKQKQKAIARDIQQEPVSGRFTHIDLMLLKPNDRINVEIPVIFINEEQSSGLKRGGTLNIVRREVELDCPVSAIPDKIVVDLQGLEIGDSIHISTVNLPNEVKPTITDRDFTIATIAAPSGMQEETEQQEEDEVEEQDTEE